MTGLHGLLAAQDGPHLVYIETYICRDIDINIDIKIHVNATVPYLKAAYTSSLRPRTCLKRLDLSARAPYLKAAYTGGP